MGNNAARSVEHRRIDMPLNALSRQHKPLFGLDLRQQCGAKPTIERIGQRAILRQYSPSVRRISLSGPTEAQSSNRVGQEKSNQISVSAFQLLHHLGRVFAHFHTQRHAQGLSKFLAKQILQSHSMTVIVIIILGTGERQHNQFSVINNVFQGKRTRRGHTILAQRGSPRGVDSFFLLRTGPNSGEQQQQPEQISMPHHPFDLTFCETEAPPSRLLNINTACILRFSTGGMFI